MTRAWPRERVAALSAATAAPAARARRRKKSLLRGALGGAPFQCTQRGQQYLCVRPQHFIFFTEPQAAADNTSRQHWCVCFARATPWPLALAITCHPGTACTCSHGPFVASCSQLMTLPRGPEPGSSELPGGFVRLGTAGARVPRRSGGLGTAFYVCMSMHLCGMCGDRGPGARGARARDSDMLERRWFRCPPS